MPFKGTVAGDRMIKNHKTPEDRTPNELDSKHRYPTSILTLTSAAVKLSRTARIPAGRRVYRGLGSMKLGDDWFLPNERGVTTGVELAFMSTTLDRSVALQYSGVGNGEAGTVMEFEVGAVDLGAQLDGLSQYPGGYRYSLFV